MRHRFATSGGLKERYCEDAARAPASRALLDFAHELADLSGDVIRPYFRKPLAVTNKAGEGRLRSGHRRRPGEPSARWRAPSPSAGPTTGSSARSSAARATARSCRWVVDPIDGTRAFIMGSPLWGTLIGLRDGETPLLGVMDQPFTARAVLVGGEGVLSAHRRWQGAPAQDARAARGSPTPSSPPPIPICSSRAMEAPGLRPPQGQGAHDPLRRRLLRLLPAGGRLRRHRGRERPQAPTTWLALIPIIERAGGRVTTWKGEPATAGGRILASGDARLHAEALAILGARSRSSDLGVDPEIGVEGRPEARAHGCRSPAGSRGARPA